MQTVIPRDVARVARPILSAYATWWALARASWQSAAVSVAAQTLTAAAVALAGRGLGAEGYGQVAAIIAYYGWFGLIAGYAVHVRLPRLLAENQTRPEACRRACATAAWLALALVLAGSLPAMLLLPLGLHRLGLITLHTEALLYVMVFALLQLRVSLDSISQSAGWMRQWSASNFVGTLLPVVVMGIFLLGWGKFSQLQYVGLLVLATTLGSGYTCVLIIRQLGGWRGLRPDRHLVRPLLSAGVGPWLAVFSNVLLVFGVQTLIAGYLPSKALGYYSIITSLSTWVASTLAVSVTIPAMFEWSRMATDDLAGLRRDFRRRQAATTIMLCSVAVPTLLWPRVILGALYGPAFTAAAPLLCITCFSWLISGPGCWYMSLLYALGHPWRVAIPNLAAGVPTFLLTYLVVAHTRLGVLGVMAASSLATLAWLVTYEWTFRRAFQVEQAVRAVPVQAG